MAERRPHLEFYASLVRGHASRKPDFPPARAIERVWDELEIPARPLLAERTRGSIHVLWQSVERLDHLFVFRRHPFNVEGRDRTPGLRPQNRARRGVGQRGEAVR